MLLPKFCRILLSGLSLFAVLAAPTLFADDEDSNPSSDQLLPPGVLLHVRISDISDMKERLPKTGFGKMYQDASMSKVRAQIEKEFDKASEEAGKDLGFPLSDLLGLPAAHPAHERTRGFCCCRRVGEKRSAGQQPSPTQADNIPADGGALE